MLDAMVPGPMEDETRIAAGPRSASFVNNDSLSRVIG
jgi:hypothetical protein